MKGIYRIIASLSLALMSLISMASVIDGNPKGKITLIEFYDYQCSHCRQMADVVDLLIDKNKDLKVVYRPIPVLGSNSWFVARAALAARAQNKFEAFHEAIVAQREHITPAIVRQIAEQAGLDMKQFNRDMESESVTKELNDNLTLSQKYKVRSIPTFVLKTTESEDNGQVIVGTKTYLHLQEALAALRSKS